MWRNDELEYFTNDDGDRMVKMSISSNMLPKITVDTYTTFTGDSWEEMELEHLADTYGDRSHNGGRGYEELDWQHYDWTYNHSREVEILAGWCVDAMNGMVYLDRDATYEVGEVTSTYSPSAYNFATDSFEAEYTLNMSKLMHWARNREEWQGVKLEDAVEDYLRERYTSCDGFISHVTPALDGDGYRGERLATLVWGLFHAWMEYEFEEEAWFYAMLEDDYSLYSETRSIEFTDAGWQEYADVVVHNRDRHLIEHDEEMLAQYETLVARAEYVPQAETLPGLEVTK
jgi:hypothetical protein